MDSRRGRKLMFFSWNNKKQEQKKFADSQSTGFGCQILKKSNPRSEVSLSRNYNKNGLIARVFSVQISKSYPLIRISFWSRLFPLKKSKQQFGVVRGIKHLAQIVLPSNSSELNGISWRLIYLDIFRTLKNLQPSPVVATHHS